MWWKMSLAVVLGVVLSFGSDYAAVAQTPSDKPHAKITVLVLGDNPDIEPYVKTVVNTVRANFYREIAEKKHAGRTEITVKVQPDGFVWWKYVELSRGILLTCLLAQEQVLGARRAQNIASFDLIGS